MRVIVLIVSFLLLLICKVSFAGTHKLIIHNIGNHRVELVPSIEGESGCASLENNNYVIIGPNMKKTVYVWTNPNGCFRSNGADVKFTELLSDYSFHWYYASVSVAVQSEGVSLALPNSSEAQYPLIVRSAFSGNTECLAHFCEIRYYPPMSTTTTITVSR